MPVRKLLNLLNDTDSLMVSFYGFIQRTVSSEQIINITYLFFFILLENYSRGSRMPSTQIWHEGVKQESENRAKVKKGLILLLFFLKNSGFQFPSRLFSLENGGPSVRGRFKKLNVFHLWCLNCSIDENWYIFLSHINKRFRRFHSTAKHMVQFLTQKKQCLSTVYKNR